MLNLYKNRQQTNTSRHHQKDAEYVKYRHFGLMALSGELVAVFPSTNILL